MTHPDEDAVDARVLWNRLIVTAIVDGELRVDLDGLSAPRRAIWASRFEEVAAELPIDFPNNGWVVHGMERPPTTSWRRRRP